MSWLCFVVYKRLGVLWVLCVYKKGIFMENKDFSTTYLDNKNKTDCV